MPWNPVMVRQQGLVNKNNMNMHKVTIYSIIKPRAFQGCTPKIWRNKRKRHKITNMQKLSRRDYNFNVDKDQIPLARFHKNSLWKGDFISFKSTTHDIIEFNPVSLVIVASHIKPRAMIIASFTSMLRISVKDCDHYSQPGVWGNNYRQNRIKPFPMVDPFQICVWLMIPIIQPTIMIGIVILILLENGSFCY